MSSESKFIKKRIFRALICFLVSAAFIIAYTFLYTRSTGEQITIPEALYAFSLTLVSATIGERIIFREEIRECSEYEEETS